MSDLDARVAALMGWHDDAAEARHKCGSPRYSDAANFARKALERAIRIELQGRAKPAAPSKRKEAMHLHKFEALGAEEPTQEEVPAELENYSRFLDAQMAEPAQEEITDEQLWEIWRRLSVDMGSPIKATFVAYGRACIRASKGEKP